MGFGPTGLLIILDERSSLALQVVIPLIAGIGVGMLFHTPFGILTELMPPEDLAGVTGAFFLVRFIGATTGLVSWSFVEVKKTKLIRVWCAISPLPTRSSV